ncbi:MAG: LysM domain-containing protein [Spirochaetia bacterium]
MPRAERISNRLDTLLEAVFDVPPDPFSLYWEIAAQLRRDQHAQAQTKIRKTLRQRGEISAESAVLVACVLHLTGFPAHRILHFLSLYLPGGIRLSLFDLAVSAIFLEEPPIPAPLLYDLTQYTYLEKRLLVRKSIEISGILKGSLSPAILLYLYLGGASLEEYGEIARAWKNAEKRSLDLEISLGSGAEKRGTRAFDRDSASFFLDKYFSDEALSQMRSSAPPPPSRHVPLRGSSARPGTARAGDGEETSTLAPTSRAETAAQKKGRGPAGIAQDGLAAAGAGLVVRQPAPEYRRRRPRSKETANTAPAHTFGRERGSAPAAAAATVSRGGGGIRAAAAATVSRGGGGIRAAAAATVSRGGGGIRAAGTFPRVYRGVVRGASWRLLRIVPTVIAAVVMAVSLVSVPAGFRMSSVGTGTRAAAPAAASAAVASAQPQTPPSVPATTTYVVRPGDSLWKIFTSMRAQSGDRNGWMDFLSKTQSLNSLGDPDRLQPGKVLTFSSQE